MNWKWTKFQDRKVSFSSQLKTVPALEDVSSYDHTKRRKKWWGVSRLGAGNEPQWDTDQRANAMRPLKTKSVRIPQTHTTTTRLSWCRGVQQQQTVAESIYRRRRRPFRRQRGEDGAAVSEEMRRRKRVTLRVAWWSWFPVDDESRVNGIVGIVHSIPSLRLIIGQKGTHWVKLVDLLSGIH